MIDAAHGFCPIGRFVDHSATNAKLCYNMFQIHQYPVAKSQCLAHLHAGVSAFGKRSHQICDNKCKRADIAPRSEKRAAL
ncbi:hypothetical protein HW561_14835 [Rhodobacteraceae bacterium B1Z28]|uniref:SET domain-containing protein n=1 Tax=Ruegeria haliotis TaxID=2747601 RepID=A0ABX2PUL6_9RHOB|nr:hypothetical protein [Ruegeria haliotis]NVO57066.1 hypothetical protein [Ruegeria haliotis]